MGSKQSRARWIERFVLALVLAAAAVAFTQALLNNDMYTYVSAAISLLITSGVAIDFNIRHRENKLVRVFGLMGILVFLILLTPLIWLGVVARAILVWFAFGWLYDYIGRFWNIFGLPDAAYGKKNGRLARIARVAFAPYLPVTRQFYRAAQRWGRRAGFEQVSLIAKPDGRFGPLYLGEWFKSDTTCPEDVGLVVDMTNEVDEAACLRAADKAYINIQVWDQSIPRSTSLYCTQIKKAAEFGPSGTLVHCVMGAGRSSGAVALILICRGQCRTIEEAFVRIKNARPQVHWHKKQRAFLQLAEQYINMHLKDSPSTALNLQC